MILLDSKKDGNCDYLAFLCVNQDVSKPLNRNCFLAFRNNLNLRSQSKKKVVNLTAVIPILSV